MMHTINRLTQLRMFLYDLNVIQSARGDFSRNMDLDTIQGEIDKLIYHSNMLARGTNGEIDLGLHEPASKSFMPMVNEITFPVRGSNINQLIANELTGDNPKEH